MEITFKENKLEYLSMTGTETMYQEETTEVSLPDSLPDADRILEIRGCPVVRSRDFSGSSCTVNGGIPVTVLYLPADSGAPEKLEAYLSFRVRKELPGAEEGAVQYRAWLRSLDARMINARKLLVRANLASEFTLLERRTLTLAAPETVPACLQLKREEYEVLLPRDWGEKEFSVDDELPLPETAPEIETLLSRSVDPFLTEWKMLGSKAAFKGELKVRLLYRDENGGLQTWEGSLPFSQYLEMEGEWDDGELLLTPMLTGLEMDTDGHRTLLINCSLLVQATVLTRQTVTMTVDAYSTDGQLKAAWEAPELPAVLELQHLRETGTVRIPAEAAELLDHTVLVDRVSVRREGDRAWLTAPVTVGILYWDEERQLRWKTGRAEVTCTVPMGEEVLCSSVARAAETRCVIRGETVEVLCELEFFMESRFGGTWSNLCAASVETVQREGTRPSVIIRRADQTVIWEIAKANRSTVDRICAANHLTGDSVKAGTLLLIPLC